MRMVKSTYFVPMLLLVVAGCGHTHTSKIGLVSLGDLNGKVIPKNVDGPVLTGKDYCHIGGDPYFLSDAVRDALKGTEYDTLVDVEVETKTGIMVMENHIIVRGKALNSKALKMQGGGQ
jgi:hypothetical protein